MKVTTLSDEEMNQLIEATHSPPIVRNQTEQNRFQAEIRKVYDGLVDCLSPLGEEGDYYGVSDFAVRPNLSERSTVVASAPHARQFTITVLTEKFFRSNYLQVLHQFLSSDAPDYQIWVDQDFDPNWIQTIVLTCDLAQVHCTNEEEAARLQKILGGL